MKFIFNRFFSIVFLTTRKTDKLVEFYGFQCADGLRCGPVGAVRAIRYIGRVLFFYLLASVWSPDSGRQGCAVKCGHTIQGKTVENINSH